jgi:hypothetical protein
MSVTRLSRRFLPALVCAVAVLVVSPLPAAAQEGFEGLCSLLRLQHRLELEDLELEVQHDETRLRVAEELYALVEGLWQNDIMERLPYMGVKHRRDAALVSLELSRQELERQHAIFDQYELACAPPSEEQRSSEGGGSIEEAFARYEVADCAVRELEVRAFEVDLEYYNEVLDASQSLRLNDVASRQQVLFAERDVEVTEQQLAQARRRVERCRQ